MSVLNVTWLDLLHELCLQNGYALLLTSEHQPPGFAERSHTVLASLDVVTPYQRPGWPRHERLRAGELIVRCDLAAVNGDLQAAAELLVGLLAEKRSVRPRARRSVVKHSRPSGRSTPSGGRHARDAEAAGSAAT